VTAASLPAGAGNTLVINGRRTTWERLPEVQRPPVAAFLVDDNAAAAAAVWSHVCTRSETLVVAAGRVDSEMAEQLRADGLAVVRRTGTLSPVRQRAPTAGRLWLTTSGSTGRPKRVAHTLESLTTVAAEQPRRTWLCPYSPGAYAWWQVVTLSLAHPGQDVVFVDTSDLDSWPELALEHQVTAASGTPTFWRRALWHSAETVGKLPLQQVTLGGEPVDQAVLNQLHELFPTARVSWIYASSEAGATIAVHDGKAGFPIEWLDQNVPGRPRLSIDGGELLIDSPYSARGSEGALRTGDRAEVVDTRVFLTGRLATDEINVGGSKVSASAVREALLSHAAVAWAQVRGRRAPLVGQVVTADVVLSDAVSVDDLTRWCAQRLPEYAVPRRFRVHDDIPIKETLKSDV
jgi:acyl-CoA synthetase (AMP-forming)/AMP-acid ligase II